jgi:hypothetical protein
MKLKFLMIQKWNNVTDFMHTFELPKCSFFQLYSSCVPNAPHKLIIVFISQAFVHKLKNLKIIPQIYWFRDFILFSNVIDVNLDF